MGRPHFCGQVWREKPNSPYKLLVKSSRKTAKDNTFKLQHPIDSARQNTSTHYNAFGSTLIKNKLRRMPDNNMNKNQNRDETLKYERTKTIKATELSTQSPVQEQTSKKKEPIILESMHIQIRKATNTIKLI